MGRKKIAMEKLEPAARRRTTFKKRVVGIKKKAKEISILTDAQVLLLLHSPDGKYHLSVENSTFDDVVQRFLSESQENRDKRGLDTIKVLQSACKKDGHMLRHEILMDHGTFPTKKNDFQDMELADIKEKISKIESRLGPSRNINEIDEIASFEELTAMENLVRELLGKNEQAKALFIEQQRFLSGDFMIPYKRFNPIPIPAMAYPHTSGIDQPVVSMPDHTTSPYQRISMGSTSTAVPMPTYPWMAGMEQQARNEE